MNIKNTSSHKNPEPENKTLYIVGTPIGNLSDLSLRGLNILKNVSLIACEDTRQTKKIMNKYGFKNKLISFNKNNSIKKIPQLLNDLKLGKSIALVSDAGMPGICDPGEDLVRDAKFNQINVVCIPGPCAALTAVVSSGMPSSKFIFEGFLPKKKSEKEKILFEVSKNEKTTIIYESPHRLTKLLIQLREYCGGDREIQVFRELTKRFEENIGNTIDEVLNILKDREILGEITIIIKGVSKKNNIFEFDELLLKKELKELIEAGLSLSAASKYLSKKKNLSRNLIYNLY